MLDDSLVELNSVFQSIEFLLGVLVLFVFSVTRIVLPPFTSHKSCGVLHLSQ